MAAAQTSPGPESIQRRHLRLRRLLLFDLRRREREHQLLAVEADLHVAAVLEGAEEDLVGELASDLVLDQTRERAGAELRVVTLVGEVRARGLGDGESRLAVGEAIAELADELVDDAAHHRRIEGLEHDARVETVAELGAEDVLVGLVVVARDAAIAEADPHLCELPRADVA